MTACWLAANAIHERGPMPPCEGRLREVHLIPKALLKREGFETLGRDPRGFVWACGGIMGEGGHHGMLDTSRKLRVPRERLPEAVESMAAELGLTWWLRRTYGPLMASCEACGAVWEPEPHDPGCPSCEGANVVRVAGEL